ncbi:unnamed protein product [Strongylus vulgaris]|uniref:VWFA domain-containing protein n=1 Tax=Strongylus vulgaris TaxID=40348 RepID=A0A3P7KRB5_STRVU|nr:unnamed protein product [Strongylus vulgaris]
MKSLKWGVPGAFVAVLIVVGVVVAFVLTSKKGKAEEGPVMYFAIHLGDEAGLSRMRALKSTQERCSLEINAKNSREAIRHMNDVDQRYAFIFYADSIDATAPMTATEALQRLNQLQSVPGSSYNQES